MPPEEDTINDVKTVSVLIVDDQPPFRAIARTVVDIAPGFEVIAEAESAEDALDQAAALSPALVLMDINLPGINGIDATKHIVHRAPETVVILLSTYDSDSLPRGAADCGAARYVHKEDFSPAVLREVWDAASA